MFSNEPDGRFRRLIDEGRSGAVDFGRPVKSSGRVLCHFRSGENEL